MESDQVMSSLSDLVHSSTKLLEQAAPSAQFPPLQRSLDQLEALSKKLKAKTLRNEAPSQSSAATRLLAREGVNAEQLARDLKSFELKTTFEDVFPIEATSIEEYLQQVHEMAMVSAIQEAQKDNLRSFNKYMMDVFQADWQKEKRDFLQSMSKLSALPRNNVADASNRKNRQGQSLQNFTPTKSPGMDLISYDDKSLLEQKTLAYAQVVSKLNKAREHGLPFKAASAFKSAYEGLKIQTTSGNSVTMQKMWHLILTMTNEDSSTPSSVSKTMSMVVGARRHLEWGHEKHIMDMIQSHPAVAALGGAVGRLQKIRAFLRIRLRDYGILDFDADDNWRQPPVDTTWQQIYYCLRTGYYDDARQVALSSRSSHHFAPLLAEWMNSGGAVSSEVAAAASEECEKMLRVGDRMGKSSFDKKKLLLYAMISSSRKQIDRLLREFPTLFNTIEDFLWYKLAAVREETPSSSYSLHDLQSYLNKFEPSHYTKSGKDPFVYPYILFLSIQLLPAVQHLSKEASSEHNDIDAVHIAIALADHGMFPMAPSLGLMDCFAEVCSLIRQYGAAYLRQGNLGAALEYYVQAAAAVGGGELSWSGRCSVDQQRQRDTLRKQLLTELLLRDGGVVFLLGSHGAGEEAELVRFFPDFQMRHQFLLDAARQCQESALYDMAIEIYKRVGAFSLSLETINKCLSEAINALSRGRLDGESRITALNYSANEILEISKYSSEVGGHERDLVVEQEIILRQLEAIVSIHKLSRGGNYGDAIRETAKAQFLSLDPRRQDASSLDSLSPLVMSCVPDLLKVALNCLDKLPDTDGSLRAMRSKIAHLLAANVNKHWPRDLYEKVARHL